MSARSVESAAVASASFGCAVLPEATPTTLPTAVTAVADATANPRTEIRLTRFPSSIARFGDPGGRNRAPGTGLPTAGSREARARWTTPLRERRVKLGRHTTTVWRG